MSTAVIIPFRDRGKDWQRHANLVRILEHWGDYQPESSQVIVADDGRHGDAQFNRSAAYNRGVAEAGDADMLIFAESDLLVSFDQIDRAVAAAQAGPGMVIPFSWFMAIPEGDSILVRGYRADPVDCASVPVKGHRDSIGAINVMSRYTYDLVGGYDEQFEGAWYDDDAMKIAFDVAAGPTRWVEGSAYHLHHLSGGKGAYLSRADRIATSRNRLRLSKYRRAGTPEQIRELTAR